MSADEPGVLGGAVRGPHRAGVMLVASGLFVSDADLIASPALRALAADECAWQIEMAAWQAVAPHRWQVRALSRWAGQGKPLFDERERLRARGREQLGAIPAREEI